MPLVNLIAEERRRRAQQDKAKRVLFIVLLIEMAAVVLAITSVLVANVVLQGDIASGQAQIRELEPRLQEVKQAERQLAQLAPRLDTLKTARERTLRWVGLLGDVSRATPDDLWLTGLQAEAPDKDGNQRLVITGTASEQRVIGDFMLGLNPRFQKVNLQYTQKRMVRDRDAVDFELYALVEPAKKPEAPK